MTGRPALRWPDLFTGLSAHRTHAVEQTVAAEWLEGWRPLRADVADLVALARDDLGHGTYLTRHLTIAAALPVARRLRLSLPAPYLVRGTTVLRNNFGFRDAAQLRPVEFAATASRLLQVHLGTSPPARSVDAVHVLTLHRHVFQDVFGWAGQTRVVDLSKNGDAFAPVGAIPRYLREVEIAIAATDWHRADRGAVAYALAAVYVLYNHAHPFREGNGRTGTLLLHQLAGSTRYRLDLSSVTPTEWIAASRDSAPFRRTGAPSPRPLIPLLVRSLVAS
ncbi:Fic family protein [Rhodococcus sp. NPDC127528]|uniref:Fic family protein n=1 Tax=unclassified Rhodococcus (in: high G+C Gram-positive bacteria) TaxID=192944 RepID=UPI00362F51A0